MHLADGLAHSRYTTDVSGGAAENLGSAPTQIFPSAEPNPVARGPA